jgi:hypothetical protein
VKYYSKFISLQVSTRPYFLSWVMKTEVEIPHRRSYYHLQLSCLKDLDHAEHRIWITTLWLFMNYCSWTCISRRTAYKRRVKNIPWQILPERRFWKSVSISKSALIFPIFIDKFACGHLFIKLAFQYLI